MITRDGLLTMFNGAIGAMTFGIYHQYTTNRIIEINNNNFDKEIDLLKKEIYEIKKEMIEIKNKKYWYLF